MPPILHPQVAAFLRDIKEHPEDDTPRLVYADWLEENGDADRAEFIRLQCELERLPGGDERVPELRRRAGVMERAHARAWLPAAIHALNGGSPKPFKDGRFRRGFLDSAYLQPRRPVWLTMAADALALEPLRRLTLGRGDAGLSLEALLTELAATPHFDALQALRLDSRGLTTEGIRLLASAPHLGRLTELDLSSDPLSAVDVRALVGTPLGGRLTSLAFEIKEGEEPGVLRALQSRPGLPALRSLHVSRSKVGGDWLRRLVTGPPGAGLTVLELFSAGLGAPDAAALVSSPLWPRLERLALWHGDIGDEGAGVLLEALPRSALRDLTLMKCGLTAETASRFAAAPSWGRLEALDLGFNHLLGDAGAVALAGSPRLAGLRTLVLTCCWVGEAGAVALAASPHAAGLRRFEISGYSLPRGARAALRKRFRGFAHKMDGFDGWRGWPLRFVSGRPGGVSLGVRRRTSLNPSPERAWGKKVRLRVPASTGNESPPGPAGDSGARRPRPPRRPRPASLCKARFRHRLRD
jgi:uncharacterized protein (TIGR02996 family)